jgi:hypothetical protein
LMKKHLKAQGFKGRGPDQPDETRSKADAIDGEAFARAIRPRRRRRGLDRVLNGAGAN